MTRTRTRTGTGMWTTGVTAIALCTSCSRAKNLNNCCNIENQVQLLYSYLFHLKFYIPFRSFYSYKINQSVSVARTHIFVYNNLSYSAEFFHHRVCTLFFRLNTALSNHVIGYHGIAVWSSTLFTVCLSLKMRIQTEYWSDTSHKPKYVKKGLTSI